MSASRDFANLMKEKNVKESTKNLAEAQKNINEAGPEPFNALEGLSLNLAGPVKGAATYFAGMMQSKTIGIQMELYERIMEFFDSDSGKATIEALGGLLVFFIEGGAIFIDLLDKFAASMLDINKLGNII